MIRTAIFASVAFFAFGAAAHAADPILPAPTPVAAAPAMTHDWSGFYAGINAGFGSGEAYEDDVVFMDNFSGFLGGVQAGANFQTGMFVLGVEGDIQLSTMSDTLEIQGGDFVFSLDYFGTVRARAGVALDNVMPYLTGGVAFGRATADGTDLGGDTDSQNHVGWTVGGGLEVAMDESVSFKAEYLYTDLGTAVYSGGFEDGLRFHTVRAGVNFHF
ncbi:outer membrane protein [Pelagibacterium montanilacus]|uniref:outer membrane protein n=1 Tax=Pelagibacterium montanilacus TaxID=2185280 RepID=UPI000F8D4B17|nr:outer membrane protein [Pelagibacterium montanilacus]